MSKNWRDEVEELERLESGVNALGAENARLRADNKILRDELRACHDREWLTPHEGLPAHEAGDFPDDCGACAVLSRAKEDG